MICFTTYGKSLNVATRCKAAQYHRRVVQREERQILNLNVGGSNPSVPAKLGPVAQLDRASAYEAEGLLDRTQPGSPVFARVAQMDSAFHSEGKGRKFESCREHHFGPVGELAVPVALSRRRSSVQI